MSRTNGVNKSGSLLMAIASVVLTMGILPKAGKGKLKPIIGEEDFKKLPEAIQAFYDKEDGEDTYTLSTDDGAYRKKLDEFRGNNVTLKRQKEELQTALDKFKDVDPERWEQAKEALDFLEKDEDAKLLKSGKFEEVVSKRTKKLEETYKTKLKELEDKLKLATEEGGKYKGRFGALLTDTKFSDIFNGISTPKKGAMADILRRARETWDTKDEELAFRDAEGSDPDGKPWTPESWAKHLISEAPYFFEAGTGGGGAGGQKGKDGGGGKISILRNPTPAEFAKNADAIAKGEVKVQRD
jgi:hypothetical protein